MTTATQEKVKCYHCGEECRDEEIVTEDKVFCCQGCLTVYEILQDNNLCTYYDLNDHAGVSLKAAAQNGKFDYLDNPEIALSVLDYHSEELDRVTLYIPSVHCSSCVWLLENFYKIRAGVLHSRLNFLRKELSVSYDPRKVSLKEMVSLLSTLGYEPHITLEDKSDEKKKAGNPERDLIIKIGVTGFCMGNIMLMSFPEYFHLDMLNKVDITYQKFFLYFNFLLSLPIFFYGASDYLKSAWISLREYFGKRSEVFSVDIPIALGITALFGRSVYETFVNQSAGYYDSLAGLVFFLLTGKWVQQVTYRYLSFERNYRSYFPLAVRSVRPEGETFVNVSELQKGDIIRIHHEELVPADAVLLEGKGSVDYSFVSGESDPVTRRVGDTIYAGGRQKGGLLTLKVTKPVSQSYLTQLWNNESFKKEKVMPTTELANVFSKYFTVVTLLIALVTGVYWWFSDRSVALDAVTAVLMVACPCALTLSMPFTMGTTMGIFGRNKFYVKNQGVIQLLCETRGIVFDKTGTLTRSQAREVVYHGEPLTEEEKALLKAVTAQSTHPVSRMIHTSVTASATAPATEFFYEYEGKGVEARSGGHKIQLGNGVFTEAETAAPVLRQHAFLKIDGLLKGYFEIQPLYRRGWKNILERLSGYFGLYLLSGDNEGEQKRLAPFFRKGNLRFHQTPQEKLDFIKQRQASGEPLIMVGDGLNDAGALRESHVGIALSEDVKVFSPACDAIMDASVFERLPDFIAFSRTSVAIVKISFLLSVVYNFMGIGWAVSGELSPVLAAIFMPLSSLSVVLFAFGLTHLAARWKGFYSSEHSSL